nr:MAG TPA: hypothetical protein [Caudoviricetes sp.]
MYRWFFCGIVYLRLDQEWLEEIASLFSIGIIEKEEFYYETTFY